MTYGSLSLIISLLFLHWVGDFVFQGDKVALNKSKDKMILSYHCFLYCLPLCIVDPIWAIYNGVLHFIVDFFTSKINSSIREKDERHWFFVMIGLDQLIHYTILFSTLTYFQNHGWM